MHYLEELTQGKYNTVNLRNFRSMKNQLAILSTSCLLAANAVLLAPVTAQDTPPADVQPSVSFVCGQSYDPTSKTNVPTTLAVVEGRTEPFALIR